MRNSATLPILLLLLSQSLFPCTSAVISGVATPDGRPLLWKHRDTDEVANKLVFETGHSYDFVGVANQSDSLARQLWMGSNSAGFAIMNTASYNLNAGQTCAVPDDQEGFFMRTVLGLCADISDFEAYLDSTNGQWGVAANFGVIDAQGGAAYYEKGYYGYAKYDANDPQVAPDGYLIRTNFSMSGPENEGYGFIRYAATTALFKAQAQIDVDFILKSATRNFRHALLGTDLLTEDQPQDATDEQYVLLQDYVVRTSSAATLLIQGVLPGEDPLLTTLWTVLGWQPVTLVTPVWVRSEALLPKLLRSDNYAAAPLNVTALKLKAKCFPIQRGNGKDYLQLSLLSNQAGEGYLDQVLSAETEIIKRTKALQQKWRRKGIQSRDLQQFNRWLERYIRTFYKQKLGETIP